MGGMSSLLASEPWLADLHLPVDVATLWVGMGYRTPPRTVSSHGRSGLRWEFDVEASRLEVWANPQAGKSRDIELRNFSNRDDHTRIFDRIVFTRLEPRHFVRTEQYDPLHTIIDYGTQRLHIAQHPGHAAVIVWCDGACEIDIKGDKADSPAERSASMLSLVHPDRGHTLLFAAAIAPGGGAFQHQIAIARGRSLYARARLEAGCPLVIHGELAHEPVQETARALAAQPLAQLLTDAARIADAATLPGMPVPGLPEAAEHERLVRLNRRILWMSQDASGAMRDGPRRLYNLLWVRGGGLNGALAARIGMPEVAREFLEFTMANPSEIRGEEPEGMMFGCLHGPINKWEEDGLFYVVLCAWTYWSVTGDDRFLRGRYRWRLDAALDWLERYCFDAEVGLYGRFHHCETPFEGSHDWTHDFAVGAPFGYPSAKWQGRTVTRSYDVYINLLQYQGPGSPDRLPLIAPGANRRISLRVLSV
jgi:hypothetical protein